MSVYNPLVSLFEELFPTHPFKFLQAGSSVKCFCPFHENHKTRAMVIYPGRDGRFRWTCFTEQIGGVEVQAVMKALNCTRADANRWLIKNGRSPERENDIIEELRSEHFSAFLSYTGDLLQNAPEYSGLRAYLVNRGLSISHLNKFPIGVYPGEEAIKAWLVDNNIPVDEHEDFLPKRGASKWEGSVIFFYKNSFDRYARLKLRNVIAEAEAGEKVTKFLGPNRKFEGYFPAARLSVLGEHAIAVEGEFDVLSLYSLVLRNDPEACEPIYSFSGGSNLSKGIDGLKDLGIEHIYVFPDNDSSGINYVNEIATIHAHTFIMSPPDYLEGEDPNEWGKRHTFEDLQAAYESRIPAYTWIGRMYAAAYAKETPENKSEARSKVMAYAKKLLPVSQEAFLTEFAPITGVSVTALKEELLETTTKKYKKIGVGVDFGVHMAQGKKEVTWEKIANFIPEHKYDILYNDGNKAHDMERSYVIDLITKDKKYEVTISNTEYNDDRRLQTIYQSKLGSIGQIAPKMIGFLRDASLNFFSDEGTFREDIVYSHTGWNEDRYLMPNCYIDANGYNKLGELKVELPPNLGIMFPYGLEEPYKDMTPIRNIILDDLLTMFPYEVTLPTIAHTFLTPLLHWMPDQSPYALWLHGVTGTFKSTFASLMLAFNGKNSGSNGLISMNSTVNAIEKMGYHLKDVVIILDDYKKSVVKDELLVRLIQNYGGRQGRSRLSNRAELQQTFYIRGNVIVTAEDTP